MSPTTGTIETELPPPREPLPPEEKSNTDTDDFNRRATPHMEGNDPPEPVDDKDVGIAVNNSKNAISPDAPADRGSTVTPQNPTPPTNIPCVGQTPPTAWEYFPVPAPPPEDPLKFAAATAGTPHEGAGTETYDEASGATSAGVVPEYTAEPNADDPSNALNQPDPKPDPEPEPEPEP